MFFLALRLDRHGGSTGTAAQPARRLDRRGTFLLVGIYPRWA
jgi:hypothetical protein